jgi:hypothetical protein
MAKGRKTFYLKYNLQVVWDCCMDAAEQQEYILFRL